MHKHFIRLKGEQNMIKYSLNVGKLDISRMRKISNEELANLPHNWLNPLVDTTKYYQCVLYAFEVDEAYFNFAMQQGLLCQKYLGKFYIA